MPAYVIFDVEIRDMVQYQEFMKGVKPAVEAAGGKYLARGGAHKVYEGDWEPRRIVLFEFPSVAAFESFYDDAEGVQTACAAMAAWLAKRIEGKPGVVGLELQNEPVLLFGADRLDSFNALVGGAVRRAAPTLTIFFEPNSTRNISDMAPVTAPVPG